MSLSSVNTFCYCPRRFWYQQVAGEWHDNAPLLRGSAQHSATDTPSQHRRAEKLITRRSYYASDNLGVAGFTDVVEETQGLRYPVEYKRGHAGPWLNDMIQLCLQAMLIEEAEGAEVPFGYLCYLASNRRVRIEFDTRLRDQARAAVTQARELLSHPSPPDVQPGPRCHGCSLRTLCLPDEEAFLEARAGKPPAPPSLGLENTLYLDEPGLHVGKRGNTLHLSKNGETIASVPLAKLEQVVLCAPAALSSPALHALLYHDIHLVLLSRSGRYEGELLPEASRNSLLRARQYEALQEDLGFLLARGFVQGKLHNLRATLLRGAREYPHQTATFSAAADNIHRAATQLPNAATHDQLLGLEGTASAAYFSAFDAMLSNDWPHRFTGRSRRPPRDPVNALLSFAYSLLLAEVVSALHIVGLDPYFGFLHGLVYGRPGLALDLMEEFRPVVADAVVRSVINRKQVKPDHFKPEGQGWYLTEPGREAFYRAWDERRHEQMTHPVFGYRLPYHRLYELQARIVAKVLTGELDRYYPLEVK